MTRIYSPTRAAILAASQRRVEPRHESTDLTCITLVALILFQRLAIPVGSEQAPLVTFLVPAFIAWLMWRGQVQVSKLRLVLFFATMSLTTVAAILNVSSAGFSLLSLLYLWILYPSTVFTAKTLDLQKVYRVFLYLMLGLSLLGMAQFAAQFAGVASIDPLDALPQQFVLQGYNTFPALYYGAALHKANAVVFMEPSHLSKALAIAILIELLGKQRKSFLLCFFGCYATTFSGTGIIALIVGIVLAAHCFTRRTIMWAGGISLVLIAGIWLSGFASVWLDRASELDQDSSSATARFVNPYILLADLAQGDHPWFGTGPGTLPTSTAEGYEISPPAEVKMAYEYGIPAALLLSVYITYCICSSSAPPAIRAAMLVIYFFLGGSLLEPLTIYFCFLLSMLPQTERIGRQPMSALP